MNTTPNNNPARILIVEDEAVIAMDLEVRVKNLGYHVVGVAAHADRALVLARTMHPDLALMDVHIFGERDGVEVATVMREEMNIPSVFLTAYSDDETILRAAESSPLAYLIKPIAERELRAAIEISLYKRNMERLLEESHRQLEEKVKELQDALNQVRELSALLPICAWCKKIRDEKGYWEEVSQYIAKHTNTRFTHGICDECQRKINAEADEAGT